MKKTVLSFALLSAMFITSCGSSSSEENESNKNEETKVEESSEKQACHYELDNESVNVSWTAYKYTTKAGVGGTFDEVEVSGFNSDKESLVFAIGSMQFSIPVASTNTNNPDRDAKIKEHFFGTMTETNELTGYISSMSAGGNLEGTAGSGNLMIKMNEAESEVPFTWAWENDTVTLTAEMDVTNWGAEGSVTALNEVCKDLHTGEDGESKLWPNVSLKAQAVVHKVCE